MDSVFKNIYLPNAEKAPKLNPSFSQVLSSAFGLENDVGNMLDYMTRPTFTPDTEFKFSQEFDSRKLPPEWMPILADTTSKEEFDFKLGKLRKEYKDRAVLAAGGWGGTVAAISAGILSPTLFIPFTGQARGVKAFAEMLGLAAVGAGAQNGALFLNQETRTEAEFYEGIAMDTLLMGMMGGAWLGLSREGRSRLAADVPMNSRRAAVPTGSLDNPNFQYSNVQIEPPDGGRVYGVSGRFNLLHGYSGRNSVGLSENYGGPRYSEGNNFGDGGLYLDGDGKWTANDPKQMMFTVQRVAEVEANFSNALVVTPQNIRLITKAISDAPLEAGEALSQWAKENGYDGLILTGFDENARRVVGPIEEGFDGTGPTASRMRQLDKELRELGINPDLAQDQVLSFGVNNLKVLRDNLPPGTPVKSIAEELNSAAKTDAGMGRSLDEATIRTSDSADARAAGAQVSRTRNTLGAKAAPNRVRQAAMNMLGRLSPSYRMLTQPMFASLRNAAAKLDMSGIQQAGLATTEASAKNGTVIERIRGYDYGLVKFAKTLDENYYSYVYGTKQGFDFNSPTLTQLKSHFGKLPAGKLNWTEYKSAVFDALNTGEVPPDLAPSVSAFENFFKTYTDRQTQYLRELTAEGLEIEPLFKELASDELGDGIEKYAHHIFSKQKLMDNMSAFIEDFASFNEGQLTEAFTKAQSRYRKKQARLAFERSIADMDQETITAKLVDVESDLEFLEELPEWQDFRNERLAITRQAREEDWPKEQLKAAIKNLQDNLPEETKLLQNDRKELMSVARALRKFGGDASAKVEKLKLEIDKTDGLIDSMFRTELPGIMRADLSIGRLQQQSDKALSTVTKGLTKTLKSLQSRRAKLKKLLGGSRANTTSRQKVMGKIEAAEAKHSEMLYRLETVTGQQVARDEALSELSLIREFVVQEANRLVRKRAAKLEDLEDKLEAASAKPLTPEGRSRMGAQIDEEVWRAELDFENTWGVRGERSGESVSTTTPDFKAKSREMAIMLHQKLMGTEVELSPAYRALRQDARGAELLRVMKIPYEIKSKYLEKDVELVTRAYDRVMGPDLELWRAFDGSVNGKSVLGEMQEEATAQLMRINDAAYVKLPKGWTDKAAAFSDRVKKSITELGDAEDIYLEARNFSQEPGKGFIPLTKELRDQLSRSVHDAVKASTRDFDVAIRRLRATRSVPDDPGSIMWRAGKAVKNLNVMTMMGGVVTSSISDVARPVWRHGVGKVFSKGWGPFVNKLNPEAKEFRLRSKEINQRIGLSLEPMLHSRAQGLFDLGEDVIGKTKIERGINLGANKMGLIAMYDYWTAGMKTIAGNVFHATMSEYVPAVTKAIRAGVEPAGDVLNMRTYLRNLGLSDVTIHKIALQMEKPNGVETFSNGGILPNLDVWDDVTAYQAYQAAALKEVNELIVTPGLERPNWTDENMAYSLLAQFKSFTFSSTSRMAMSGLQGNDPYLIQGLAFSLAFGAVSYYTYAITAGGKTLEAANKMEPDKFLWEAVKRSGIIGALSIGTDAMEKIPLASGEQPTIFTKPSGLLGVFLGPTYGQAERMAGAVTQLNSASREQQERNLRAIRQVFVPFQNHFLFRQLLDRVGDALIGG